MHINDMRIHCSVMFGFMSCLRFLTFYSKFYTPCKFFSLVFRYTTIRILLRELSVILALVSSSYIIAYMEAGIRITFLLLQSAVFVFFFSIHLFCQD